MKAIYQSIWVELPYMVVSITELRGSESLNAHAKIALAAVIEDEKADEYLYQRAEDEIIRAGIICQGEEGPAFFTGYVSELDIFYDRGQAMMALSAVSFTKKWDIKKSSRSFQNLNLTYADIIDRIIGRYPGAGWISRTETDRRIEGLILQYEETDWEFLCRLATHFSTCITVDASAEKGGIYFGIPQIAEGRKVGEGTYEIVQNIMGYQSRVQNAGMDYLSQDNLQWRIVSREHWKLGEQLSWNQVACQVTAIETDVYDAEILYCYTLSRKEGLLFRKYGNEAIVGLSLPAVIRERSGNRLRVQFEMDPVYETGNNVYYTYAIETVSWYCMPETGSLVHRYFPTWDESCAAAVHAMQLTGAQAGCGKGVGDKSFTTCDGKEMLFTESGITFLSDQSMASSISLSKSGTVRLEGNSIMMGADSAVRIGEADITVGTRKKTITARTVTIQSVEGQITLGILEDFESEEPSLKPDTGIVLLEDGNVVLQGENKVYYIGERKEPPLAAYEDDDLKAEDAAQREAHNIEVLAVRNQEGNGKIGFGTVALFAGLAIAGIALSAATVATEGATLPLWKGYVAAVAAAVGTVTAAEGLSTVTEGMQDKLKMHTGDFSQSYNPFLTEIFGNDRQAFYQSITTQIMMGTALTSIVLPGSGKATQAGIKYFLKQAAINTGKQVVMNMGMMVSQTCLLDAADGYIDMSMDDYAKVALNSAKVTALGSAIMTPLGAAVNFYEPLNTLFGSSGLGKAAFIGIETGIDVGVDAYAAWLNGADFELTVSLFTNLASNVVFSIDPVDVATGGMILAETDMAFRDIGDGIFTVQRFYNSAAPYYGSAGRKWHFSFESRLFFHDGERRVDLFCTDGHTETFLWTEDGYENKKGGRRDFYLEKSDAQGYVVYDRAGKKEYIYGAEGELRSVSDRAGNRMEICYSAGLADRIVTFSGHVISIVYQDGCVAQLHDETGRSVLYKYKERCMTDVCHVDKGITTYCYDDNANITKIVDPKGTAYVINEYDDQGRVVAQYYPDGTKSTVDYDTEHRQNVVYIEAFDRTERYRYNADRLVTYSYYDDGTCIEYGYDQWQNRIYEKDRMGNETKRTYDIHGELLREEKPCGQWESYEYDDAGNMIRRRDAAGEEAVFSYDTSGNLLSEAVKIWEEEWAETTYERDRYGRMVRRKDGEGNETAFEYGREGLILEGPICVTDAVGKKTCYEYDHAGRCTAVITDYGRVEFAYNALDLVTYEKDGEGNETRKFYDKAGKLKFLIPPGLSGSDEGWSYEYDFFGRLIKVCDPLGTVKYTERDLTGKILREVHPQEYEKNREKGAGIRHEYDRDRNRLRTIWPDGSTERRFYDPCGNLIKRVMPADYDPAMDDGPGESYEYDGLGRLIRTRDAQGNTIKALKYDQAGNVTEETDALGSVTYKSYDLQGRLREKREPVEEQEGRVLYCVTRYEYDRNGNCTAEHRGLDQTVQGEEPIRWGHIRYTYDKLKRLIKVEDGSGARLTYRYDCLNQKVYESSRISDDISRVIRYCYDRAGRLTEKREELQGGRMPGADSQAVCAITRYEYDANGNCIRITTPKGYQKERQYDKIGRVTEYTERDPESGIARRFLFTYDRADNPVRVQDVSMGETRARTFRYDLRDALTHFTDEVGGVTRLFYDRNGRVEKVIRPNGYDPASDDGPGIRYAYDRLGKVASVTNALGVKEQEYAYDAAGRLLMSCRAGMGKTHYVYNLRGDCVEIHDSADRIRGGRPVLSRTYDARGNVTSMEDGNGCRTAFVLDEWGRITQVYTPEGGVERYTYDYAGNIISTVDACGGTIHYRYNSQGKISEITDQEGNREYFMYDREGYQELHTDRNGNVERTRHGMDGRLLYRRAEDKKGRNACMERFLYYPDGRLERCEGGGISYHYQYTPTGLLKEKREGDIPVLTYAYDGNGNLTRLTDREGRGVCYAYDTADRLEQITDTGSGQVLASYGYTPGGQPAYLRSGNGSETRYRYGEDGNLAGLVSVTADGNALLDYTYAYDGNGNCIKKSGSRYRNEYAYDSMGRLAEAIYDGRHEKYHYDLAGNRILKESGGRTEQYIYNDRNQLIRWETSEESISYRYDPQGNLLSEEGKEEKRYTYDALNRLTEITGGIRQTNRYDGEGLRYESEADGEVTRYLYDRGELAAESCGERKGRYVRGYDTVYSEYGNQGGGFHIRDEAGSVLYILGSDHEVRKSYRYDAFGRVLEESGELSNRLTYTGQIYDEETGLYYLRARYYNPSLGRFLQEDTYRGDGLNLYAYCANNPVMYFDPSGYIAICPVKGVNYKKDKPLDDPKLKAIYDKWRNDGFTHNEALDFLTKYGNRPDIEYLIYLNKYAEDAYQTVLAAPGHGFTGKMQKAFQRVPFLRNVFIGTMVDGEFKRLVESSPYIPDGTYAITKQGQFGADLIYLKSTGVGEYWVDITTTKQADRHFKHYKGYGFVTAYR